MGITRHSLHKRRSTGGKKVAIHKKRKYDMGRQAANTKLSNEHRTHTVRGRGGHIKFRALRMHTGNFAWGGEGACPPPPSSRLSQRALLLLARGLAAARRAPQLARLCKPFAPLFPRRGPAARASTDGGRQGGSFARVAGTYVRG